MMEEKQVVIGESDACIKLTQNTISYHGMISGKERAAFTTALAESYSKLGIPVFISDTNNALTGLVHLDQQRKPPIEFWDFTGQSGHPVRATISSMGALILSRLLDLNETQSNILGTIFRISDEKQLLLIDLLDLRSMLQYVGEHGKEFTLTYGHISKQSIGSIIRNIFAFEDKMGKDFFGEPELALYDLLRHDENGHGYINLLQAKKIVSQSDYYGNLMLWLLSDFFETLPLNKEDALPKMVFFIQDAQLLFQGVSPSLFQKIMAVIQAIRSKGIIIMFELPEASDLPKLLKDRIDFQIVAENQCAIYTCCPKQGHSYQQTIPLSSLNSKMEPIRPEELQEILFQSPLRPKYCCPENSFSAFEQLKQQETEIHKEKPLTFHQKFSDEKEIVKNHSRQSLLEKAATAVFTTIGREVARSLTRGILDSLKK